MGTAGDNFSCVLGRPPTPTLIPSALPPHCSIIAGRRQRSPSPGALNTKPSLASVNNIPFSAAIFSKVRIVSVSAKPQNLRLSVPGQLITGLPERKLLEASSREAGLSLLHPSAQRKLALVPWYRLKTLIVFQKQNKRMKENRSSVAEAALPGAWKESWGRESREGVKEVCRVLGPDKVCKPRDTAGGPSVASA